MQRAWEEKAYDRTPDQPGDDLFELNSQRLGLDGTGFILYDVWSDKEERFGETIRLDPNGVLFIRFER